MFQRLVLFLILLTLSSQAALALGGTGTPEINEADITAFVYVDGTTGNDSAGNGSQAAPYGTIRHALLQAAQIHSGGQGVKVVIMPGTYLEGNLEDTAALLMPYPKGDLPFVIEGYGWAPGVRTGDVIITGSQVWTGWTQESPGVFYSNWPHDLPTTPFEQMGAERDLHLMKEVVLRKEMIHVNGVKYYRFIDGNDPNMQYLEPTEGAMWFDEANDRLYVKLPQTTAITDLNNELVEATVRQRLWHFWRAGSETVRTPFVIRNLVFQHAGEYGLYIQNGRGVIVEDCAFLNNNLRGFGYETNHSDLTFRRSVVSGSGEMGMGLMGQNILAEDIETTDNGRQSYLALFFGNGIGGVKFGHSGHVTLRRWNASDNYGLGIWLDTGCHNFLVEHSDMNRNTSAGIFVENNNRNNITLLGNQYTAVIRECTMLDNIDPNGLQTGKGVQFTENENALVEHCLIYGNQQQISIADGPLRGPQGNIQFRNNVIGSESAAQDLYHVLYGSTGWLEFFDTLNATTNDNLYYHPTTSQNFRLRSQELASFSSWKSAHLNNNGNLSSDKNVDSRSTASTSNINGLPLVRVAPVFSSFVENQGTVDAFTFRRVTEDLSSPLTIQYTVRQEAGDATIGADFAALSGSVTIPAGAATATLPVTLLSGDAVEPTEPLALLLSASANYVFTAPEASFFIQDENGSLPSFGLEIENAQTIEGDSAGALLRVVRSGEFASSVAVQYALSGSATAGTDYEALSGTIHFAAGQSEAFLSVVAIDDASPEFLEDLTVTLASSPDYGITTSQGAATVTLLDDDRISHDAIRGGLALGTGPLSIPVTLHNPSDTPVTYTVSPPEFVYSWKDSFSSDITYDWIEIIDNPDPAANGTVVQGVASSGSDTELYGEMTWSFRDGARFYGGVVRNPQPNTTADATRGADFIPLGFNFNFYDNNYSELLLHSGGFISFSELHKGYFWKTNVSPRRVVPGTAYFENKALPDPSQFPTTQNNKIAALWDWWNYDPGVTKIAYKQLDSETFVITWQNMRHNLIQDPGTTERSTFQLILRANGSATMQYKEVYTPSSPSFGATVGITNLARDKGLTIAHNNNFILPGMAIEIQPPSNWLGTSATEIVVPANSTATVDVLLDATQLLQEAEYQSQITISAGVAGEPEVILPVALDVGPQSGELNFDPASYQVNEGDGTATVTVRRSGGSDGAVGVTVQSADGTALAGIDYTSVSQIISWADGDSSAKTVTVTILNDAIGEFTETATLNLINATGGADIGSAATATLTLLDDDGPRPTLPSGVILSATVGLPFSYQVVAGNTPFDYQATGLPAGLSIDHATGLISGNPNESGSFSIGLSATNGNGTTTEPAALSLTVAPESYQLDIAPGAIYDNPSENATLSLSLLGDTSAAEHLLLTTDTPARLSLPTAALRGAGASTATVNLGGLEDGLDTGHASAQLTAHRTRASVWAPLKGAPGQSAHGSNEGFGWQTGWIVTQGSWIFEDDSAFAAVEGAFGRSIRATGASGHGARRTMGQAFDGSSVVWVAFAARDFTNQHHVMMGLDAATTTINNAFNCHLQFGIHEHQVTYRFNHGAFNKAGPVLADTTARIVARIDQTAGTLHLWLDPATGSEPTLASALHQVSGLSFQNYLTVAIGTFWENVRIGEIRIGPSFASVTEIESFSTELEIVDSETATGIENWRMTHFGTTLNTGEAADLADPDFDGFANLLEYAFGTMPDSSDSRPLMDLQLANQQLQLSFTPAATDGLTYTIQTNNDLLNSNWTDTETLTGLIPGQPHTWTDSISAGPEHPRRFLRLKVTTP